MTELKTLNDFRFNCYECDGDAKIDEIKEEAIKHLKLHNTEDNSVESCTLTGWIEYFFNITEDDLK